MASKRRPATGGVGSNQYQTVGASRQHASAGRVGKFAASAPAERPARRRRRAGLAPNEHAAAAATLAALQNRPGPAKFTPDPDLMQRGQQVTRAMFDRFDQCADLGHPVIAVDTRINPDNALDWEGPEPLVVVFEHPDYPEGLAWCSHFDVTDGDPYPTFFDYGTLEAVDVADEDGTPEFQMRSAGIAAQGAVDIVGTRGIEAGCRVVDLPAAGLR